MSINSREKFRDWLTQNSSKEKEIWLEVKKGKPVDNKHFWYIDAVEEALCFGWIDSTTKNINGKFMQKFSPRSKTSVWSELNKERVRRLEKLGKITEQGRNTLPEMNIDKFVGDKDIIAILKEKGLLKTFFSFPPLYQRVRLYNVSFNKKLGRNVYKKSLEKLLKETSKGKMYGEWNDYGRLLDY